MKAVDWFLGAVCGVLLTLVFCLCILATIEVIQKMVLSENEKKAYILGKQDQAKGKERFRNPFKVSSDCHDDWENGWSDANDEVVLGGVK